jgi:putative membrane protein
MGFGMIGMALFWIAVIVLVVVAVRGIGQKNGAPCEPRGKKALEILEERYARGEIDKAEFEERKRTLTS